MQGSLRLCPSLPKRPDAEPEPETELTPIERAFPAPLPGGGFPVARCGRTEVYRIVLAYLKALPERLLGARGESHRPSPHTELLPRRILEEIAALCRADARCPLPTTKILVPLVGLLEEVCGAAFHVLRTACVSGWSAGEIAAECRHLLTAETTMCATARNEVRPAELRILGGLAGRSWLAAGVRRQYGNPSKFDPEASVGLALGLVYVARFASGPASDESKVSINGLLAAALGTCAVSLYRALSPSMHGVLPSSPPAPPSAPAATTLPFCRGAVD